MSPSTFNVLKPIISNLGSDAYLTEKNGHIYIKKGSEEILISRIVLEEKTKRREFDKFYSTAKSGDNKNKAWNNYFTKKTHPEIEYSDGNFRELKDENVWPAHFKFNGRGKSVPRLNSDIGSEIIRVFPSISEGLFKTNDNEIIHVKA